MPFEIYDEIADWIKQQHVRAVLVLDEKVDAGALNHVFATAYAADLADTEVDEAGRDPFLIAYGCVNSDHVIVTKEVSKPTKNLLHNDLMFFKPLRDSV